MAHFAELDSNNIVLRVLNLDNSVITNEQGAQVEQIGINFLRNLYGQNTIWAQTSYNTRAGVHYDPITNKPSADQSKAFRKNYAGEGWNYDLVLNAFINPKPVVPEEEEQYVFFDEFACLWKYEPPTNDMTIEVTRI